MSFQQISKLYLRGSMFNKTLRNMPEEDIYHINVIIEELINDPILERCKNEFCRALSRTIKNEYVDLDVGKQDYCIAIMKAVVTAKVSEEKSIETIMKDPIQRKKWFQTWVFNYLKQILRENKIPAIKYPIRCKKTLNECFIMKCSLILNSYKIQHNIIENVISFKEEITLEAKIIISDLQLKYFNKGLKIEFNDNNIVVENSEKYETILVPSVKGLREYSFDNQDVKVKEHLESKVPALGGNTMSESQEIMTKLKDRVPERAHPVLHILVEDSRPDMYVTKYGEGKPKVAHMSEFLGISIKEIKKMIDLIKIHIMVLHLGY